MSNPALESATKIAARMVRGVDARTCLKARVETGAPERVVTMVEGRPVWTERASARLVFEGGAYGTHSIDVYASSFQRMVAHWQGYCENNGLVKAPLVGETVSFPSGSASKKAGFRRRGKVVKVTGTRVTVSYTFKSGKEAARKTVWLKDIW